MMFFVAGLGKFIMGTDKFHEYMMSTFQKTFLPASLVSVYAHGLPFVELIVGAVLIVGIFRCAALVVCGLTLLSLAFGQMLIQGHAVVEQIFVYLLITSICLMKGAEDKWVFGCCCGKDGAAKDDKPCGT